jgi:hypothetical protein
MDPKILREAALAYQAVYDEELRQELEEQQDFENWVNSLVEEGYDLSEYTWEEMYETYLDEAVRPSRGGAADPYGATGAAKPQPQMRGLSIGQGGFRLNNKPVNPGMSPIFQRPGARPPASTPAARPSGSAPSARPSAAPAARPASTAAARPAASAPTAKPAPTSTAAAKPAPGTKAAGPESIKPKTPNPLMQKTFGYQTGNAPDQQKARADAIVKSGAVAALKPAATPTTPTTQKRPMGSVKPGSLVSSFDMFDIVKGYLIDEGYADTEDAAISIMASMSENWKTAIIAEARAEGVKAYRPNPTQAEVRADAAKAAKKKAEKAKGQSGYGPDEKFKDWKDRATPSSTLKRKGGETETVSQRMDREKPYAKRMTDPLARRMGSRAAAAVDRIVTGAGEPQAVTYPRKGRDEKKKVSKEIVRKEDLELYNYILSHLLDEGYASDVETAEGIIENMSDEWILSILG